jgi:hypothetical protein
VGGDGEGAQGGAVLAVKAKGVQRYFPPNREDGRDRWTSENSRQRAERSTENPTFAAPKNRERPCSGTSGRNEQQPSQAGAAAAGIQVSEVHVNSGEQQGRLRGTTRRFRLGSVWRDKKARSTAARAKVEKAYEDTLSSISEKEVLMGTVVGMNKKEVVINIGYKSEGVVPLSEFRYKPDLADR